MLEDSQNPPFKHSERRALTRLTVEWFQTNPKTVSDALTQASFRLPKLQGLHGMERVQAREALVQQLHAALTADGNETVLALDVRQ